jgi:hypothetical protein
MWWCAWQDSPPIFKLEKVRERHHHFFNKCKITIFF